MKKSSIICLCLIVCILLSTVMTLKTTAEAATPIKHTIHSISRPIPTVLISIRNGRIFFIPYAVSCSHAKPCFILKYATNTGPRPIWLNATQLYVLHFNQSILFTFPTPGINLFTLFHYSQWWKIKVIVS